ncbi:MAG TPA: ABC transporter permease [Gemmatimonadaceae bacterium]
MAPPAPLGRKRFRDWMDDIRQDVRYAARGLARRPTLTAAAVLCLAIGIGANAAMFGVVDQLLLRPPSGVRDPRSLAWIRLAARGADQPGQFSYQDYLDFQRAPARPQLAAYHLGSSSFGRGTDARDIEILIVTHSFLSVLGATPAFGRFIAEQDEATQSTRVVVLGYALWQSQFAGRTDIVGQTVRLGTTPYTVVGIAPQGFNGLERVKVDAYVPPTFLGDQFTGRRVLAERGFHWATVLARTEPGASRQRLVAELNAIYRNADPADKDRQDERVIAAAPGSLITMDQGQVKQVEVSFWSYGVSGVVLLVACANVAALLLVRATARRREIAIRLAMGISRARLARLLITESLLLAALGCALAVVLARFAGGILRATVLSGLDPARGFVDVRLVSVALATAVLTGLACGLAPALKATRSDLTTALKLGERDGSRERARLNGALVVCQVALSLVLVVSAALFAGSLRKLDALDLGFDAPHLVRARVTAYTDTPEEAGRFFGEALGRVRTLPGVRVAALATGGPFGAWRSNWLTIPGRGVITPSVSSPVIFGITPDYFEALGAPILRGRGFGSADATRGDHVTVVNDLMAKHYWPSGDALGKCIRLGRDTAPCATIVGIVRATRQDVVPNQPFGASPPPETYYVPFEVKDVMGSRKQPQAWLYVRSVGDAAALVPVVRRAIQTLAPDSPILTWPPPATGWPNSFGPGASAPRCSRSLAARRSPWRSSDCTACWRFASRSERTKLACEWRSARNAATCNDWWLVSARDSRHSAWRSASVPRWVSLVSSTRSCSRPRREVRCCSALLEGRSSSWRWLRASSRRIARRGSTRWKPCVSSSEGSGND